MQLENFEKWFPFKNAAAMYYIENISYDDGIKIRPCLKNKSCTINQAMRS